METTTPSVDSPQGNFFSPTIDDKEYELPAYMWGHLEEGQRLIIQRDDLRAGGQVDAIASDASIFWVWLDDGRGRIAVYPDDNIRVWRPVDTDPQHV